MLNKIGVRWVYFMLMMLIIIVATTVTSVAQSPDDAKSEPFSEEALVQDAKAYAAKFGVGLR